MANNADQIVVAQNGSVNVAPTGTSLPTTMASLSASFTNLGYATEDGASLAFGQTTEEIMAWQSRHPVRRILTGSELTIGFALLQWTEDGLITAFGGGAVTEPSSGVYRYDFIGDDESLHEHVLVLDWQDGDNDFRLVVPRVTLNDSTETSLQRTSASGLPVSLKALKDDTAGIAYLLSNSADIFEPAS